MDRNIMMAPWRMKYLTKPKAGGCFLCDAVHAVDPENHLILASTDKSAVIMNRYPYNNGHLMVLPVSHSASLTELDGAILSEMMSWLQICEAILKTVYQPDGFNVGINIGAAAGAGLASHLHIHIVPRWEGDTNFITTCGETRVIPEDLGDSFKKLQPLFAKHQDADPK